MKYIKMLGLTTVTALVLMAFVGAGSASATVMTCAVENADGTHAAYTQCTAGQRWHFESEGKVILHPPIGSIECNSTVQPTITNPGSSTTTATASIPKGDLTFTSCNATVTVLKEGTLEIHTRSGSDDGNGTLTSTGTEVTVLFSGFHCIFSTNNTDLGTLTGSGVTKSNATLDIEATIPRTGGSSGIFCGSTAQWTGSYKDTNIKTTWTH